MRSVDPAIVYGKRLNLLQEICSVSLRRLRAPRGGLIAEQKSADGIVGHAVGKASEALRHPKGGANGYAEPGTMAEGPNERRGK
jgi:hypothetical protein